MQPHVLYAKAGDVMLWHADLLHGAEEIRDAGLTRRSLVAHYYGRRDCEREGQRIVRAKAGYWLARQPQPADLRGRVFAAVERRWWRVRAITKRS